MSAISGRFLDTIIDLRPSSPTYMQSCQVEISAEKYESVHIPRGCANSFLTLEPNTVIHYYVSGYYHPESEVASGSMTQCSMSPYHLNHS